MPKIRGILPPVLTLVDDDERIDEGALVKLLHSLYDAGVHGLYFLGSAGEFVSLRNCERRRAIEIAVREMKGRLPIIVGTMDTSTMRTIDNARMAEDLGADAIAVTAPTYYTHNRVEVLRHFELVTRSVSIPVYIYNIPQTTKVMLDVESICKISTFDNVAGIKDSSGKWSHVLELLHAFDGNNDFSILVGDESLAGIAILMGADGAVMAIANIAPRLVVQYYEAAASQEVDKLKALHAKLSSLARIYECGAPISCLKVALSMLGIGSGKACEPMAPVSEEGRRKIAEILSELQLLPSKN
ncbi:MAG TPA: dihydrodipicolinate synthase family protein [Armatimonadetes bacterium]|nr:dihydrodipicolinate synthase family protein [Armatimonadota bacterium]